MSDAPIRVDDDPVYPTITLANPSRRNVLAIDTMRALTAALQAIGETGALGGDGLTISGGSAQLPVGPWATVVLVK